MAQFNEQIAFEMLSEVREQLRLDTYYPTEDKSLVILGGQPGAGKSTVSDIIESKFQGNIVLLNGDDFKSYYPDYKQLLAHDPDKTAELVQPYSNYVVDHLKQDLIAKELNVMIEGTMRTLNVPLNTINEFKEHGYKVEAFVIAVNHIASRASCIERYENDLVLSGAGRSVNVSAHDNTYQSIPETLKGLVDSRQLDNLTIMSRSGEKIVELANGDDIVKSYKEFRELITPELYRDVRQQLEDTMVRMYERGVRTTEFGELQDLRKALTQEFDIQRGVDRSKDIER